MNAPSFAEILARRLRGDRRGVSGSGSDPGSATSILERQSAPRFYRGAGPVATPQAAKGCRCDGRRAVSNMRKSG